MSVSTTEANPPPLEALRHPGRWVAGAAAILLAFVVLESILGNSRLQWDVVGEYLFDEGIMKGLRLTIILTFAVTAVGMLLGTLIATARMSKNPVLAWLAWFYVWVFRSVPLLVQLLLWFNIAYLYPKIEIGLPFLPPLIEGDANKLISATTAAFLGLTLHEAAYAAEIVRGGILSVDPGQTEAGDALGMSRARILRRIVLPQAMRSIVPAAGNLLIGTLKGTAIVSVIAVDELLYAAQFIYNRTFEVVPLLVVATLWYMFMTAVLSVLQYFVERYYGRGATRSTTASPWAQAKAVFLRARGVFTTPTGGKA
ncbi:amino acid ABC transporter permease [Nocardioides marmoriginsengisoli]|uniref:Amino acid ABC transporter permease n=1 Tax=Nocardioides marmoriginsengisoli TaxID=661483 RepID=A0A3N0CBI2_9ACTN|nr:amino acid ABC transporter permease [Nocardioides marmoriginsengisoli]RNL60679.1 amino acid ABC transporter permease [Nocardioides marmoriginsengisoli]